ncbi:MAG: hypothetical protein LBT70_00560, partial [Holosporaceae bacterium]|nr:hypothetical protein [Holosporaceae bacterium]
MKNYCSNRPETRQNHCIKHILGTGLAPAATSGARKINKFDVSRQICKIICLTLVLGASSSSLFGSDPTAGKFYYDGNKMEVEADYVPANGTIDSLANADDQANALVGATGESPFGIYGTSSGDHAAGDGNTDTPYVIGGHSTSSGVTGNTLNVGEAGAEIKLSKTATSEIYAGLGAVAVTGEEPGVVVTGNTLNIKGAVGLGENNDANFYGGRSRSTVGTGGAATSGDVSNNDIEVREAITGTEGLKLIGGQSDATATGLTATSGDVKNNKVTVEAGGDIKTGGATTIIGGSAKALAAGDGTENFGKVSENKVDIKAKITASTAELYGGFTESSGDAAVVNRGTVGGPQGGTNGDGNKLTLDAEKSIEVSGYDSDENAAVLSGGYSAKGNSQYNTLTIRGNITAGTDAGNIDLTGGSSDEGEALNNTLTVGGISVIKSESEKTFGDGGTNSTFISLAGGYAKGATNSNRLEISGTIKSTKNARIELSGGYGSDGSSADGNTLSLLSNSKIISTGTD